VAVFGLSLIGVVGAGDVHDAAVVDAAVVDVAVAVVGVADVAAVAVVVVAAVVVAAAVVVVVVDAAPPAELRVVELLICRHFLDQHCHAVGRVAASDDAAAEQC